MKKFLIFALILAVAGGAFAQSLTFSGWFETGFGVRISDADEAEMELGYVRNADYYNRFHLAGVGRNASGTGEMHFGLRWNNAQVANVIDTAHFRYTFMDGLLQLIAGRGGPGGFGPADGFDVGGGTGVSLLVHNPVPNLRLGVVYLARVGDGAQIWTTFPNARFATGVRYEIPGTAVFALTYRYNGNAETATNPAFATGDMSFGADLSALTRDFNLTRAVVDFRMLDVMQHGYGTHGANTANKFSDIRIRQLFTYQIDTIQIGLEATQSLRLFEGANPDGYAPTLRFNGWVQYTMGTLVPRLNWAFGMGNTGGLGNFRSPNDQVGDGIQMSGVNYVGEGKMGLALQPQVQWNLDRGNLQFGVNLGFDLGDHDIPPASTFNTMLFVYYRYEF